MKTLFFLALSALASAQTVVTVTASPTTIPVGTPTTITLSLNADGRSVAGLQYQYSTSGAVTLGPPVMSAGSLSAGKSGQCNNAALICGLFGVNTTVVPTPSLNANALPSGVFLTQAVTFKAAGVFPLSLINLVAVDPTGTDWAKDEISDDDVPF